MDLKLVKDEALSETERVLAERLGIAPDPESDAWEEEYRRQFELAKRRHAQGGGAAAALLAEGADTLPRLQGTPADERWAQTIRAERLKIVRDKAMHAWLAGAWVTSKAWIESRDLDAAKFLSRVEAQYADHRRCAGARSSDDAAQQRAREAEKAARLGKVQKAGITAAGLIGLIDVSERLKPAGLGAKLAEVTLGSRNLRVFASDDPKRLMVLEKDDNGRRQYAIPHDDGLVADLKLYAESLL
jgi:hypothetical protein